MSATLSFTDFSNLSQDDQLSYLKNQGVTDYAAGDVFGTPKVSLTAGSSAGDATVQPPPGTYFKSNNDGGDGGGATQSVYDPSNQGSLSKYGKFAYDAGGGENTEASSGQWTPNAETTQGLTHNGVTWIPVNSSIGARDSNSIVDPNQVMFDPKYGYITPPTNLKGPKDNGEWVGQAIQTGALLVTGGAFSALLGPELGSVLGGMTDAVGLTTPLDLATTDLAGVGGVTTSGAGTLAEGTIPTTLDTLGKTIVSKGVGALEHDGKVSFGTSDILSTLGVGAKALGIDPSLVNIGISGAKLVNVLSQYGGK